jgi:aminopeptidase N
MRTENVLAIRLAEYEPPSHLIDVVELTFRLTPSATRVVSKLWLRRQRDVALQLNGVRLKLVSIAIDGRPLPEDAYVLTEETLTLTAPTPERFTLETEVEIDPLGNTALEGLYMSAGRFCTQCESEGFRKITYFLDRPDVLSRYTVRLEADPAFPRLLCNGNLLESGQTPDGRRFAVWNDPFPKPAYLFALVAGELDVLEDSFETMSGRVVDLQIFVDPGQSARAAYAMDSLKRAMAWDERVFGREYDLDLFMIVAVRDFNFGAMENKGLNIFNSSLLLADSATATDLDYERIEGVVAHEYFHNWTGNRITCRDWFQLCLKEGLTVFRDQSFSADMRGEAVQRIKDVKTLRARQFSEDAGPLAHPVRPSSYVKIDNFYTATIYEKGAEIIRMLKVLIGEEAFDRGMTLYFDRWDGHATTVEAFIACFAETSGRDLGDFFAWYEQAGTPQITIASDFDEAACEVRLTLRQSTAPTPGQPNKRPLPIPIRLGLLDADGTPQGEERLVVLDGPELEVRMPAASRPIVSALRGFSAPVTLVSDAPARDLYVLMADDPDLFNRWEAGQTLARGLILKRAGGQADEVGEERFAEATRRALQDQAADDAFKALALTLPSEADLALLAEVVDPHALHEAREALRSRLAAHLELTLFRLHAQAHDQGPFSPDAASAGRRALRNACIELMAAEPTEAARGRALGHFRGAANMTEAIGGLNALMLLGGQDFEDALAAFYERWRTEPLVIDKWFALQARAPGEEALGRVMALTAHPAFDPKNPNRLRALVQAFASSNPCGFHDPSGAGYRFLVDQILMVDGFNPSVAARLVEPLGAWRRYRPDLGALMKAALQRIVDHRGVSSNVLELAAKALQD